MPTLDRNRKIITYPKGSKTADAVTGGHHPVEALQTAVENFQDEHGYEPEQNDRCWITITFTTSHTVCEILEFPG